MNGEMTDKSRLLRLLVLLQSHAVDAPPPISQEALARAGFVVRTESEPPPDRFVGRRILAWIEEREAKRLLRERKLRPALSAVPGTETDNEVAAPAVGRDVR